MRLSFCRGQVLVREGGYGYYVFWYNASLNFNVFYLWVAFLGLRPASSCLVECKVLVTSKGGYEFSILYSLYRVRSFCLFYAISYLRVDSIRWVSI